MPNTVRIEKAVERVAERCAREAENVRLEKQSQVAVNLTFSQRRRETDRAHTAIMEDERRSQPEKNARLREWRLGRTEGEG